MNLYSGWEYLLIDAANHYGLDKLLFEERIQWATENLSQLEAMADQAEAKPLYIKAVQAIREAQAGAPTGHLVAFDACCSGIQIMSALTGCVAGATATGMVDPNKRADAYTAVAEAANRHLQQDHGVSVDIDRDRIKTAVMTATYGSKAEPKHLFGEDTPELQAFYSACFEVAPGAFGLLQDLTESWQPYALVHEWRLPDGFLARIKVMDTVEKRIEVDELNHATFTYQYKENVGMERGVANVANVVHSIDAYVLRSMVRRCNYDRDLATYAQDLITRELTLRALGHNSDWVDDPELSRYLKLWRDTDMADVVILPHLLPETIGQVPTELLRKLAVILEEMLSYQPFPIVTVHDAFASHANNVNQVRYWYKEILAELAESNLLTSILNQIHGITGGYYPKMSTQLPEMIRQSNYALS